MFELLRIRKGWAFVTRFHWLIEWKWLAKMTILSHCRPQVVYGHLSSPLSIFAGYVSHMPLYWDGNGERTRPTNRSLWLDLLGFLHASHISRNLKVFNELPTWSDQAQWFLGISKQLVDSTWNAVHVNTEQTWMTPNLTAFKKLLFPLQ